MGQQIAETELINSNRRCESVLKSMIVSLRDIEAVPGAARLKRSSNANALKLVPRIHSEALISFLLMGFFARAKERTRRIKRRAMDGRS